MKPSTHAEVIAATEIACIQAMAALERDNREPMTNEQRQFYRLGFLAGKLNGLDVAMKEYAGLLEEKL